MFYNLYKKNYANYKKILFNIIAKLYILVNFSNNFNFFIKKLIIINIQ